MNWVYQHWLLTEEDHLARLILNRQETNNSLTYDALLELGEIAGYLGQRDETWLVVIQGQGRNFSTGVDLSEIETIRGEPLPVVRRKVLAMQHSLDALEALAKPTIARVQGFCLGGGLIMALACDFRIASQRSVFGLPEVKLGLPVLMGTQRISRVVGLAAAKEMILLGDNFGAEDARRVGLVHQVVAPEALDEAVAELAGKLLKLSSRTLGLAKRIINDSYHLSPRASQDQEIDALAEIQSWPEL